LAFLFCAECRGREKGTNRKGEKVMKRFVFGFVLGLFVLCGGRAATAHFGMLIPSDSMITQGDKRAVSVVLSFSHPFERQGMELIKPKVFGVMAGGKKQDLLGNLKEIKVMGHTAWQADYPIQKPGAYIFYMEPAPYWEPAEDCFIIHYTKTVVAALGDDEGWDQELGLKTEIVPLSKSYGLYAGNVFQGIVKLDGKVVPFAEVEVEYYNQDNKAKAPTEFMIAQTIKADANGVFTYAAPRAGWWGFAALSKSKEKIKREGQPKEVELGAVIWVRFLDWVEK
jgi:cobalt/nickel transport protein